MAIKQSILKFPVLLVLLAGAALPLMAQAQDQVPAPPPAADLPAVVPAPDMPVAAPGATVSAPAAAEDSNPDGNYVASAGYAELMALADAKRYVRDATVTPENVSTLFFTAWQHALLQEAKIGFTTRAPEPGEVGTASNEGAAPGIRELSLGGIAFANSKKWTVWLNTVRVTPDAIPDQVLDIKVSRSHIDLKWFDRFTNKIYPVRLRPHERFNLDSRIFLPGNGT